MLMIIKALLLCAGGMVVAVTAAAVYGNARWNAGTTQLLNRLDAAQIKAAPQFFNAKELEGLPAPAKRYFETVLKDGQPIVTAATVQHTGTINMSESKESWKPFYSTQRVITRRPGFDWDARVMLFPGVAVRIHDAYIAGTGLLQVAALGLIPLANLPESADLSKGELMRFFAEAAWYPTALLPSQGVVWQAINARSATATLTDFDITVTLQFGFGADGLIDTVRAQARGRLVGETMTYAPWQGRFWNYALRDGMQVPLKAEVAWLLPAGDKLYYRSLMTSASYEFAPLTLARPTP